MKKHVILAAVITFVCTAVSVSPSYAGWFSLENRSSSNTYHVSAELWGMGWRYPNGTIEVGPGCSADRTYYLSSIGLITISLMDPKTKKLTLKKTYQPPGAYLPWRNFLIKVYADKDETISVFEK